MESLKNRRGKSSGDVFLADPLQLKDNFKMINKQWILSAFVTLSGFLSQGNAQGFLNTAGSFAVLGASAVTSTGNTVLNGDLGVAPGTAITGFGPGIVNGTTYAGVPFAAQAQADVLTAFNTLKGEMVLADLTDQDLGGLILTAGVYHFDTSAQLTGMLTLDAQGDSNARFVFQIGSTLTTATSSSVLLINGAQAGNVFWQVGSSATLGTGTSFEGSILADQSITFDYQASLSGRGLALNGAVTMDDNVITVPTKASTSVAVSSSRNPAGFRDSVNFSATLSAIANGSVLFLTNGVEFNKIPLTGGVALSSSTTLLPRGTNAITAQYVGDSNYWGSTNTIYQVVTNHPPVAGVILYTRTAGLKLRIFWTDVATNWSDTDGDPVTFVSLNLITTNHVNLLTNDLQILYPNSLNVNDQITYTISDGQGSTNTGIINVVVNPYVTGQQTLATLTLSNNAITTTFYGIPDYVYEVQRSTNFSSGSGWVDIATNMVGANGLIQVADTFPDLGGQIPASAYYRLKWNP